MRQARPTAANDGSMPPRAVGIIDGNATLNFRVLLCAPSYAPWSPACARTALVRAPRLALSAVAFIHRFGSTLNARLHFHCVVIDAAAAGRVILTAATGVDATAIAQVQAQVRQHLVRVCSCGAACCRAMTEWAHSGGFSVDGSVRIEAVDRAGRERLLRYCARPPFTLDRLRELDPERLLYENNKLGTGETARCTACASSIIEQVAHVCQTMIVRDAWERGQPLTVHGWVYGRIYGLVRDLGTTVTATGEAATRYRAMLDAL